MSETGNTEKRALEIRVKGEPIDALTPTRGGGARYITFAVSVTSMNCRQY
jgi:hypothetical protein